MDSLLVGSLVSLGVLAMLTLRRQRARPRLQHSAAHNVQEESCTSTPTSSPSQTTTLAVAVLAAEGAGASAEDEVGVTEAGADAAEVAGSVDVTAAGADAEDSEVATADGEEAGADAVDSRLRAAAEERRPPSMIELFYLAYQNLIFNTKIIMSRFHPQLLMHEVSPFQ